MIEVKNLTTKPVKEKFIIKIIDKVLKGEKRKEENLSIALVGQGRIRDLNKRYRGKNRATDILAFGQEQKLIEPFLGELVICLREVKKNAETFRTTFEKELTKVLIHGTLHLLGYDHEKSEKEAKEMEEKENYYLAF
ncbi:MAG: rRNA maturation RNase YbeY [Candidatus Nealsonbacteria bacterium CG08_land_8_20_14_0_20_38_20]|uniref:Endoribonuclease YbeY n=1 Tax=Candidatus Nealsonbacteria bacterium CG08_land_8_20_14_0_20_38_20 TaxID=1974705 RepID=A0A2H0YM21_9BACT|nr:MAG: rRNA maturation RNase YbeY [Candidatus Nealsonbacteria bacterium CG08_land_8_20_14_0_20_38_20]